MKQLTMSQTKYNHFSNTELISLFEEKAQSSEIIMELCKRLETNENKMPTNTNCDVECPVCEAKLIVDYDENNLMFELKYENA